MKDNIVTGIRILFSFKERFNHIPCSTSISAVRGLVIIKGIITDEWILTDRRTVVYDATVVRMRFLSIGVKAETKKEKQDLLLHDQRVLIIA